jgi:hypothetical protein
MEHGLNNEKCEKGGMGIEGKMAYDTVYLSFPQLSFQKLDRDTEKRKKNKYSKPMKKQIPYNEEMT